MASTLAFLLVALGIAPIAIAQTTSDQTATDQPAPKVHKKKKKAKPAASASDSASASEAPAEPPPAPTPAPEPTPPPAPPPSAAAAPAPAPPATPPDNYDITNTTEAPNKRYVFVGLRYRGTVIPSFLEHIFVEDGKTIYSNSIGAEIDIRKGGQSMIPWIQYTSYSTGDILFLQKGKDATDPAFYSDVKSALQAIYIGVDEVWSTPIANHLDFEYGFGVGLGFVFGSLHNDWVYQNNNGNLTASNGMRLAECPGGGPNGTSSVTSRGCNVGDHVNATTAKVGGYKEPNWFQGGSVPVIFPEIDVPRLSLRYKPIKQLETRLSVGFSLTGFWFGLSADYGLEKKEDPSSQTSKHETRLHDTL